ncbi:hypothetical protein L218DRAFT_955389 [Marasmius fiardii PR-910]|nr:hypothetical protein L218DRAFT_955389 [Marasmius fiardii PR-910]
MQPRSDQPIDQPLGLVFPTHSMQNQIHELAKTLPPPRKQNTACDACRSRKVKCHRLPGQEKCQHCLQKNYPCTHYVQQATSEKKRSATNARRPRANSSTSPVSNLTTANTVNTVKLASPTEDHANTPFYLQSSALTLPMRFGLIPPITLNTPTRDVLAYLFSPPEHFIDPNPFSQHRNRPVYTQWGEMAEKLGDAEFRSEIAFDLVEVYFQIVHSRLPLLNPTQFRNQLKQQLSSNAGSEKPLHPALVATVIAWGSKFSEHPLLMADRQTHGGQGHLSKALIDRTRELAEALHVHRVPNSDHVVIGLLIETLQSQTPGDSKAFLGFWLTAATRHLLDLQINHKSVAAQIPDTEERGTLIFAWWMACICDAYSSLYYRRKPVLDDDDYDIDFYTVDPINTDGTPSTRLSLEFLGYYRAAHSLARTARHMSRALWRPATDSDGIPLETLTAFYKALRDWRSEFLEQVTVHMNEYSGDFVTTVSRFASDAQYHVMWIILFNAADEFGVKELNDVQRATTPPTIPTNQAHIQELLRRIILEAVESATRISTLVGVLASNEYLKLDPAVMLFSCIAAGQLLAKLGRREVMNCVLGLEQYSRSYEEAGDQALEIRKTYDLVCANAAPLEVGQLVTVARQMPSTMPTVPDSYGMSVDEESAGMELKADPSLAFA